MRRMMCFALLGACGAVYADDVRELARRSVPTCAALVEDAARLRCFDALAQEWMRAAASDAAAAPVSAALAGSGALPPGEAPSRGAGRPFSVSLPASGEPGGAALAAGRLGIGLVADRSAVVPSPLDERWELTQESKHGLWSFRPHKTNYFLFGRYSDSVNEHPYAGYLKSASPEAQHLDATETKFQLSFKTKVQEDLFGRGADLWFGYTQQNNWQVFNKGISAPFREVNYEPEVFLTVPTSYELLGLRGRFVNVGFVHQSNGQTRPLSRSWNRLYAQAGFEAGDNFSLLVKPWYRLKERAEDDDNPDINRYVGDYEVEASYRFGVQRLTLIGRSTWEGRRGFAQLDWTFPLYEKLRGYVQFTTGYGESMIDFNHRQNTLGIGILLTDWM